MPKHIFVTRGTVSSAGKGVTGANLKSRSISAAAMKPDRCLNVDHSSYARFTNIVTITAKTVLKEGVQPPLPVTATD